MDKPITQSTRPAILIIFGISGDLARRKVLPAIYHLLKDGLLPKDTRIIGTSRQTTSIDKLISDLEICVLEQSKVCDLPTLKKFKDIFEVIQFDPNQTKSYLDLKETLNSYESQHKKCYNHLFYLSIPPDVVSPIIKRLGLSGLNKGCSHNEGESRLLIEKPFGYDSASAKKLIQDISKFFKEEQIYRIDHYLAKETAQNIITFRKQNPLFNTLWNNRSISKIRVRALEQIGIEGRINFYERTGALRDLIQSHLLQLLAITTMELPRNIEDATQIHKQKLKLLKQIKSLSNKEIPDAVTAGQYQGYIKEVGNPDTKTETYLKVNLMIDNNRWDKVPMILETGKALNHKTTDIILDFYDPQLTSTNQITFRIQPNEGIDIKLFVKKPGLRNELSAALMDFSYKTTFSSDPGHPDAYERVLTDAFRGDSTLFSTSSEVIESWRISQPILDYWKKRDKQLIIYNKGSKVPLVKNKEII